MRPKIILTILKISATVLFYVLLLITLMITGSYIIKLYRGNTNEYIEVSDGKFGNMFIDLGAEHKPSFNYSQNQLIRYTADKRIYAIDIKPNSAMGYYYMLSNLLFLSLGLLILWKFQKIFKAIKLDNPFKLTVVKHLQVLSMVFILSDVLGFIHYFIMDKFITNSLPVPRLKHMAEVGNGIIIGLIILIIAVVYKRGLEIYEENSLTV